MICGVKFGYIDEKELPKDDMTGCASTEYKARVYKNSDRFHFQARFPLPFDRFEGQ